MLRSKSWRAWSLVQRQCILIEMVVLLKIKSKHSPNKQNQPSGNLKILL